MIALVLFFAAALAQVHINAGDIIYQLLTFLLLLAIPFALILFFKRRNSRLNRIEEKLDRLLEDKEKRNNGDQI
ncbi:MAG TPA: DUF4083 family protein [Bacillus bacterium]|nr:DUF4083 family protein [Bacillus sp. (in: firmicutes)]